LLENVLRYTFASCRRRQRMPYRAWIANYTP
jgi:hypothetical protein